MQQGHLRGGAGLALTRPGTSRVATAAAPIPRPALGTVGALKGQFLSSATELSSHSQYFVRVSQVGEKSGQPSFRVAACVPES